MSEQTLTFEDLKTLEPELARLEGEICCLQPGFDVDQAWGNPTGYKQQLCELVGYSRGDTILDPSHSAQSDPSHLMGMSCDEFLAWPRIPNPRYHPQLCTSEAYDVAYQYLLRLLESVAEGGSKNVD